MILLCVVDSYGSPAQHSALLHLITDPNLGNPLPSPHPPAQGTFTSLLMQMTMMCGAGVV